MNTTGERLSFTFDPVFPWSTSGIGLPALFLVALFLAGMTYWTYRGVLGASNSRVGVLVFLRLAALVLTLLVLLRPSVASQKDLRTPSILLVQIDRSASMTTPDEIGGQSRWRRLQTILKQCEPIFEQLREEQNVQVVFSSFAGDVTDYDPDQPPDGKRTDFGNLLQTQWERYRGEKNLLGFLIASDGADNGTRYSPLTLAGSFRGLPCPIHTFALGKESTTEKQSDLAVTAINPTPSPVPIKGDLAVKVLIDAPGFENAEFRPHLFFDDVEIPARIFVDEKEVIAKNPKLKATTSNEIIFKCTAPATPGEYKVTVKVDPLPGDTNRSNDEISTYLTVTKEGISILYLEAFGRDGEPQMIARLLGKNPRFHVFQAWFGVNDAPDPTRQDLLNFSKQPYDVIILGDVTPEQIRQATGDPKIFATMRDLVVRGTGLLMLGGDSSLGNSSWGQTELASFFPIELTGGSIIDGGARGIRITPVATKTDQFVVRLADKPEDNAKIWQELHPLSRINRLNPRKGATVLAESQTNKDPVLVWWQPPNALGRTMAFGSDSTYRWIRDEKGLASFLRFWEQMAIWLARQEETDSNIRVKLKSRRLPLGDPAELFGLSLVDKQNRLVTDARFEVKVVDPQERTEKVQTTRDAAGDKGTIWKTDLPGEYKIEITGKGKDADGNDVTGTLAKPVRFLVFQDDAETARRGADHDFLRKLAAAGGGSFHTIDEMHDFLKKQYADQAVPRSLAKANLWPNWRTNKLSPFLPIYLTLFVALLTGEWFLRRRWGLV